MSEPERDLLAEARRIAAGEGLLLATPEHLRAVFAYVAQLTGNVQQLSELVASTMVDREMLECIVPADLLKDVRRRRVSVFVEALPNGSVRLHMFEAPRPPATGQATPVRA